MASRHRLHCQLNEIGFAQDGGRWTLSDSQLCNTRILDRLRSGKAEPAPKSGVPSLIRALPLKKMETPSPLEMNQEEFRTPRSNAPNAALVKPESRPIPISPRRYKLQVTVRTRGRGIPARVRREVFERDAGGTINTRPSWSTGWGSWKGDVNRRPAAPGTVEAGTDTVTDAGAGTVANARTATRGMIRGSPSLVTNGSTPRRHYCAVQIMLP